MGKENAPTKNFKDERKSPRLGDLGYSPDPIMSLKRVS